MGVIGVDGGNTKTDVLLVSDEGEPIAFLRGGGSNSHGPGGAEGAIAVIAKLVAHADPPEPPEHGAFFLCGADVPGDIEALERALEPHALVRHAIVDNDTFALLHTGSDNGDAVAVVCGGGFNSVGRAADGRTARYPSLGWETGDWGGSEMLGREALFHAARAEDGRGKPTALVKLIRKEFELPTVAAVGEAIHYRRVPEQRLGRLAPAVIKAAEDGDAIARSLVVRLAEEIALSAWRALWDLGLIERRADVVLGGGMLRGAAGLLHEEVTARIAHRAPAAKVVVPSAPPVLGAALEALRAAEAPPEAAARLREAFRTGLEPEDPALTEVRIFEDADALGKALAEDVLAAYGASKGSFLLGCPGGRSLRTTYRALAGAKAELSRLVVVMMDEYVGAPVGAHYSCRRFALEEIAGPLGLTAEQVWLPDEDDPAAYDAGIEAAGGVDHFLLASGASDGHVAFVPPGAPRDGRTAVVELAESTRRDNLVTFPEFESLEEVPTHGVSVGLGTIAAARTLRLVLHGPDKRAAAERLLGLDRFDSAWPASIVHEHDDAEILVDRAAV